MRNENSISGVSAVVVLTLLCGSATAFASFGFFMALATDSDIEIKKKTLSRLEILTREHANTESEGHRGDKPVMGLSALLLPPSTSGVAAALLQDALVKTIKLANGRLESVQVLDTGPEKPNDVTLALNFETEMPGLRKIIYSIESGTPVMFVEELSISGDDREKRAYVARRRAASGANAQAAGNLHVSLKVSSQITAR